MTRLGLCGMWSHARGAGIVNARLYRALTELGYDVYVFGLPAMVMGQSLPMAPGPCPDDHLRRHLRYDVEPSTLRSWAHYYGIQGAIFGEWYDFAPVQVLQAHGVKTITWPDAYLAKSWRPLLKFYDQVWCITHRAEAILHGWGKAALTIWIGWGVPDEDFAPAGTLSADKPYDYVHSSGWLGIANRKGTDLLLAAQGLMEADPPETLIHCQIDQEAALQAMGWSEGLPPHVVWESRDYPPPVGVYRMGRICIQPSRIEGIGLSPIEAACQGIPIITTDAEPMTEFVDREGGWLVAPVAWRPHADGSVYEQSIVSPQAVAKVMEEARALTDTEVLARARLTLKRAHEQFNWHGFTRRLADGLDRLGLQP